MELEEIAVVLARASLLHSKIDGAIDSAFLESPPVPTSYTSDDVRSLVDIRLALESLQDQLSSLQALQLRQRADRDVRLAEIEESRRVFLKRLKEHTGRELEIIQEALTFAGGNAPEKNDVFTDSYPEDSASGQSLNGNQNQQRKIGIYDLDIEDAQEYEGGSEDDLIIQRNDNNGVKNFVGITLKNAVSIVRRSLRESPAVAFAMRSLNNSMVFLSHFARRVTEQLKSSTSKVVFVMATTILFVSLSDSVAERKNYIPGKSRPTLHNAPKSFNGKYRRHNIKKLLEGSKTEKFLSDNNRENNECFPNCFIQERTELPFYKESEAPDVLYGRG